MQDAQTNTADPWGERLPRRLGLLSAWAVLVGSTIGSGIFRTPAVVAGRVDEPALYISGWILGGLIALAGALTSRLAAMFPRTGGIYVYIREGFGPLPAFLFGWAEFVVIRPAAYGAIAITSAEYFWRLAGVDGGVALLSLPLSLAQVTAGAFIVLVAAANYRGIQIAALIQNASTVFKVGALVALIALGFILPHAAPPAAAAAAAAPALAPLAVGIAPAILWADGWADLRSGARWTPSARCPAPCWPAPPPSCCSTWRRSRCTGTSCRSTAWWARPSSRRTPRRPSWDGVGWCSCRSLS
jgi:amino acid transporter